jgi:hypothetical protein
VPWPFVVPLWFQILILWIRRGNILCWGTSREMVKPPISPLCQFSLIVWLSYHFGFVNLVLWIWRRNAACVIESKISVGENKCISRSFSTSLNRHIPRFGYFSLVSIFTGNKGARPWCFECDLVWENTTKKQVRMRMRVWCAIYAAICMPMSRPWTEKEEKEVKFNQECIVNLSWLGQRSVVFAERPYHCRYCLNPI